MSDSNLTDALEWTPESKKAEKYPFLCKAKARIEQLARAAGQEVVTVRLVSRRG